jgi:molybdopterin synthase sulfur carrier subunit
MKIRLRYFASLREAIGLGQEVIDTQATTVGQVRNELLAKAAIYQCLQRDKSVRMALNQIMVNETALLEDNAELAFFPPVTGG